MTKFLTVYLPKGPVDFRVGDRIGPYDESCASVTGFYVNRENLEATVYFSDNTAHVYCGLPFAYEYTKKATKEY